MTIGRAGENKIILNDSQVSRHHAEIVQRDNGFWIRDLSSVNGTYVNSKQLEPLSPRPLQDGDIITIGSTQIRFSEDKPGHTPNQDCQMDAGLDDAGPIAVDASGAPGDHRQQNELAQLCCDVAVPTSVCVNQAFDLAVFIRQPSSPQLAEADLSQVQTGDVQLEWTDAQSSLLLRIQIEAPVCDIVGDVAQTFRLFRGQDSPKFYWHLIPRQVGDIGIIVKVYQVEEWLGSARVHTTAVQQLAGEVKLTLQTFDLSSKDYVYHRRLRRALAKCYPNRARSELLALDVGLNPEELDLSGPPVVFWQSILDVAKRQGKLEQLLDLAHNQAPACFDPSALWQSEELLC
jgi:pSer/pThr/pTyr-binding forkhead associated (FHA) protein